MQRNTPTSDELKDILSGIFDAQIPNHGDYNLVFGSAGIDRTAQLPLLSRKGRYYVIGYRWRPQELIIAPFNGPTLTAGSTPVAINMTNLSHAVQLGDGDYEVGTSTGKTFRFAVQGRGVLPIPGCVIEQEEDEADFRSFMAGLLEVA
ncbi:MAG TPA: hypothetical protein VHH13_00665 [Arthrobacter sp.]|nr:hypothetical protein [Arthrobacter sp.]